MKNTWERIEAWLGDNFPVGLANLGVPASVDDINELEQAIGTALPADLKELLELHDGEAPEEIWLFGGWSLLPAVYIKQSWLQECESAENEEEKWERETDEYVRKDIWNKGWIPFAYDGSGGYLCLDTDPAPSGKIGQVIATSSDGFAKKVSDDLNSFLQLLLNALESKSLNVVDDCLEPERQWWIQR